MLKKKEYEYGINLRKEYKLYNKIGHKKAEFERYSDWKKHVVNKHKKYMNIEYLEDIRRYINRKKLQNETIMEISNALLIPIYIFMFSVVINFPGITIAFNQYADSFLSALTELKDTYSDKISILDKRKHIFISTYRSVDYIVTLIIIGVCIFLIFEFILLYKGKTWGRFYRDYIEVLEKMEESIG